MLLSPPCFFHLPSTDMDPLSRAPEDVQARIAALLPTRDRQALDEGCPAVVGFPTLPCRLTAHSSLPACRVRLGGANTLLRRASLDWFPEVVLVEEPWGSRYWEHKQEAEHLAVWLRARRGECRRPAERPPQLPRPAPRLQSGPRVASPAKRPIRFSLTPMRLPTPHLCSHHPYQAHLDSYIVRSRHPHPAASAGAALREGCLCHCGCHL